MDSLKQDLQRALNMSYFFLKFRPRSKREMVGYLNKKAVRFKWPQSIVEEAVLSLEEEGLVDDKEFVEWYANKTQKSRLKSQNLMKRELLRYGVDKFLIEDFFAESPVEEESAAVSALKKRWSRFQNLDKRKRFEKSIRFLQSRGFSYDIIKKAIAEIEQK